jgi:hypothetical protein
MLGRSARPPALKGIVPNLVAERGTARDGMIRWGGALPSGHILPENWVEVHWRQGRYDLEDAGAVRRFMFEVHPEVHAAGVAPEPLPDLLPGPDLAGPPLGARFTGTGQPITLQWQPARTLTPDEYYQVAVDTNYGEANSLVAFRTRETEWTLPESLYRTPNCGVFNWQVTIMRQAEGAAGSDQPISHPSLYGYVEWRYPPGVQPPFSAACPNAQF